VGALERDEFARAAWKVMVARSLDSRSLVFVDEMGTNTSLSPIYGWSKKGARAYCSVPRNRGKNTTVLASMSVEGMGPSLAVEGATTARVFETYVERVLAPTLRRGRVVVMDNLSAHKGERIRELIEGRGCELLYLPSYSPALTGQTKRGRHLCPGVCKDQILNGQPYPPGPAWYVSSVSVIRRIVIGGGWGQKTRLGPYQCGL
jgi:hypothetical protein